MVWREELTTTSTNILYNSAQNHHIIGYRWTNLPRFSTVTRIGSWRWDCFVTWFCYQLMAKPGSKTAIPSYISETLWSYCPLRKYWFWPFMCSNFIRKHKYVFACDVIPRDWNRTGECKLSFWKTTTNPFYTVNIVVVDRLMKQKSGAYIAYIDWIEFKHGLVITAIVFCGMHFFFLALNPR